MFCDQARFHLTITLTSLNLEQVAVTAIVGRITTYMMSAEGKPTAAMFWLLWAPSSMPIYHCVKERCTEGTASFDRSYFTWPQFRNFADIAQSTALSMSAVSKTMNGALPPSSKLTRFTPKAHWLYNSFPTSVDPER